MRIIPAIDIINGKCVRLSKGDYNKKTIYSKNVLDVAKNFEDNGIQFLHLVDLDGAKQNQIINQKILEEISIKTNLIIDFGGGLKSEEDIKIAFESGAKQVTLGSVAVKNPELFLEILEKYGPEKIILGADARKEKIAVSGWLEESETNIYDFIKEKTESGIKYVISTDIDKDGMLKGPSFGLYEKIIVENPDIKLIASGGITSTNDLVQLKSLGCEGAIIGKALYENRITFNDLKPFL
ncbi:1-(5-phosphoribosyl)-5-[(5-phosphoribosylamino)methylideneamino]imidazole-4-carboxamide isomerase [Epilithonimonas arachidiradicis]|uniref:1-(5-phosphoribosyl)-5-[(5-phosphoribosylamino)methylideneamino] imidazole-4-carboxamide isomerase n=1 Tax=Epilithonimonas arachidiradicis TaxID=1617282 RepID=A0A420D9U4_9FLAO|nr:1-(5-phosphoribosyl)-5-[(5-phosphoribosylamino)methylideneamino]imidazole-4-carboxamide isomerase [Epilithonimonas arachidiradicis]RKE87526.1 1-(5-phosphoribosyl)-5-[(5-phosphoribosylamino)methylideneamino] imidazole-4-carboxamide isomerase [Epilithonimonas arachidiradicis]GGG55889.1 1-(5-phosphoribosyl)-5-[(5-phosphoribosylamino) methylideneamino] imidazole-4-carboxamide isomerase [Epilithonimonas arachidiradicis]